MWACRCRCGSSPSRSRGNPPGAAREESQAPAGVLCNASRPATTATVAHERRRRIARAYGRPPEGATTIDAGSQHRSIRGRAAPGATTASHLPPPVAVLATLAAVLLSASFAVAAAIGPSHASSRGARFAPAVRRRLDYVIVVQTRIPRVLLAGVVGLRSRRQARVPGAAREPAGRSPRARHQRRRRGARVRRRSCSASIRCRRSCRSPRSAARSRPRPRCVAGRAHRAAARRRTALLLTGVVVNVARGGAHHAGQRDRELSRRRRACSSG